MKQNAAGLVLVSAALFALSSSFTVSAQQDTGAKATPPLVIQVGVDLIQIDAAITDKLGRPVGDLRPEDFTLRVDGKLQPVSNAAFFSNVGEPASIDDPATASGRSAALGAQSVVFVVDDLNISFTSMAAARVALKKFAAGWNANGAMVGLRLTSDDGEKFKLSRNPERFNELVENVHYSIRSDRGASSAPNFTGGGTSTFFSGLSGEATPSGTNASHIPLPDPSMMSMNNPAMTRANYQQRVYSLLTTVNSLRSIPGRKAVVFLSEGLAISHERDQRDRFGIDSPFDSLFADESTEAALRMIIEVANRASVVIYTLDPSGLVSDSPGADVATMPSTASRASAWGMSIENHGTLQDLADNTGGLSVYNRNDLKRGLTDVVNDQRSYYLIGFEPPKSTFAKASGKPRFHSIKLTVNRPDLRVRTRGGFYGVTDKEVIERAPLMVSPEY